MIVRPHLIPLVKGALLLATRFRKSGRTRSKWRSQLIILYICYHNGANRVFPMLVSRNFDCRDTTSAMSTHWTRYDSISSKTWAKGRGWLRDKKLQSIALLDGNKRMSRGTTTIRGKLTLMYYIAWFVFISYWHVFVISARIGRFKKQVLVLKIRILTINRRGKMWLTKQL